MTLLKTVPFTHHPTWDNCVLYGGVGLGLGGSPKIGSGPHREPTANQTLSDGRIPSISPQIVLQHAEGKRSLLVYRQTLLVGLKVAVDRRTNLSKVYGVRQGPDESQAAFLEMTTGGFQETDTTKSRVTGSVVALA